MYVVECHCLKSDLLVRLTTCPLVGENITLNEVLGATLAFILI